MRRISYTTPLKQNSLGPSTADCVEEWRLLSWTADTFVVGIEARTPKVRTCLRAGEHAERMSIKSLKCRAHLGSAVAIRGTKDVNACYTCAS